MPTKKVIDPNLSLLQDAVYYGFRQRQYKSMSTNVREGIFHVSDLVQDCMRNSFYNHMKAIPKGSMDTGAMSIFFAGESVHRMLDSVFDDETKMKWDVVRDCQPDNKSNPLDVLHGECDAVYSMDIDGEVMKCIVDYKTWLSNGWKMSKPKEEHVRQINMYKYLLRKTKDWDISYGSVIYLDFADRMAKPLVFTFALEPLQDIEAEIRGKLQELRYAAETGDLPERVKSWKCDGYCPHAERCFTEYHMTESEREAGLR